MKKDFILSYAVLAAVTVGTIGLAGVLPGEGERVSRETFSRETQQDFSAYNQLLASSPLADVEGETISPDERYEVRTEGETDLYVSGYRIPESLQVVDLDSGDVVWADQGWLVQRASWSPDRRYLALNYSARTWTDVYIIETETWTAWEFVLPDGSSIPEYTFLPLEDWCEWAEDGSLRLTVGDGEGVEQRDYRCSFQMEEGGLTGVSDTIS